MRAGRLTNYLFWSALASLSAFLNCHRDHAVLPGQPLVEQVDGRQEVLLGPRTTAVIGSPSRVRAYRVLSPFAPNFESLQKKKPLLQEYPILAEARVSTTTAQKIAGILLTASSYDPAYATDCLFEPGYAVRFERATDIVDVVICFKCGDVDILPHESLREKAATTLPFGRVSQQLYEAITEIFPEARRRTS